jgi:hypothetical protein
LPKALLQLNFIFSEKRWILVDAAAGYGGSANDSADENGSKSQAPETPSKHNGNKLIISPRVIDIHVVDETLVMEKPSSSTETPLMREVVLL